MRIARIRTLLVVALLAASGCAGVDRSFPFTDLSDKETAVVVGRFVSGRYLDQFPGCFESDVICIDPPPLSLAFRVEEHVFGTPVASRIRVATTDHFGLQSYQFRDPAPWLVLLATDGQSFVMPRYRRLGLESDPAGNLVLPIWWPDDLMFLPCEVGEWRSELSFHEELLSPRDDFMDELIDEYPEHFVVDGELFAPRYGIYVSDIRDALSQIGELTLEMGCEA